MELLISIAPGVMGFRVVEELREVFGSFALS